MYLRSGNLRGDQIKYYLKRDCCENKIVNSIEDLGLIDNPEAFNFLCGSEIEINGDVIPRSKVKTF